MSVDIPEKLQKLEEKIQDLENRIMHLIINLEQYQETWLKVEQYQNPLLLRM